MPKKEPPHGYDDRKRPIWAIGTHGRPVCGHKTRAGTPCQREDRLDNGRCHRSGKGGRPFSENPKPATLKQRGRTKLYRSLGILTNVEGALQDEALVGHRENIALLDGLMIATGAGTEIPSDIWERALKLYHSAVKQGNTADLIELGKTLEAGLTNSQAREAVAVLSDLQRKHIDSEIKREAQLEMNLTFRQAQAFGVQVVDAVKLEVHDPAILRAIAIRIARVLGAGGL